MVRFRKIQIQDYRSIGYIELNLQPGIYKVQGNNLDSTYSSNGAAKSSAMQAVMLGLYNRDYSGVIQDNLSNRITGKPFKIEVEFEWSIGGKSYEVRVVNHKGKPMLMFIDGKQKYSGTPRVLQEVEKMLGMGYDTFKLTHYITAYTIMTMTKNLNDPQLFNDILHLVELRQLTKKFDELNKELLAERANLADKLRQAEASLKILDKKAQYDTRVLTNTLQKLEDDLELLDSKFYDVDRSALDSLTQQKDLLRQLESDLATLKASIRNGLCQYCGSLLLDKDTLRAMNQSVTEKEAQLVELTATTSAQEESYNTLHLKYGTAREDLLGRIQQVRTDLRIADDLADISVDFPVEEVLAHSRKVEAQIDVTQAARASLKNGAIISGIMDRFFELVQAKLLEYSQLINLDQYRIALKANKGGLQIDVFDNNGFVPVELLSNGEKTRLSMLLILSILDATQRVSDSETNMLIFDEAAASLDASSKQEMAATFQHLKDLEQSVFIISHGSEMDDLPYDFTMTVTKQDGISTAQVVAC